MAAAIGSGCEAPVRLRLLFDYPPPVTPACGLCWLLVEPNQVRLITDLISLIREKFGFSRRARLSLFLDGALLPPTESARLVRDNDSLRVRLEEIVGVNSYNTVTNGSSTLSKKQRKRQWRTLEAEDSENEDKEHNKSKSKWNFQHQEEKSTNIQDSVTLGKKKNATLQRTCMIDTESNNSHSKKPKGKNEQRKGQDAKKEETKKASTFPSRSTSQKTEKNLIQKSAKGNTTAQSKAKKGRFSSESSTSSSDSDYSIPGTKQTNTHAPKGTSQHIKKPPLASLKTLPAGKPKDDVSLKTGQTKETKCQSSSSDSDSSSEEEQQSSNLRNKLPYQKQGTVTGHSAKTEPQSSSSESDDSSESETCALKKQKANVTGNLPVRGNDDKQLSDVSCGLASNPRENGKGRGRGETPFWRGPRVRGCRGMTRDRGRGERAHFFYNSSCENQKQKQLNEAATNATVIIQNPVEAPKKDYSTLPLLAAPPQVGQKIAFKLLELTENYTPEVSDYKEGKIVSWNPINKQLDLELLSSFSVAKEPGKFDLVYQSEEGDETIEYAVSEDRKITQSWEALIEPRLIIDSPSNESDPKKESLQT